MKKLTYLNYIIKEGIGAGFNPQHPLERKSTNPRSQVLRLYPSVPVNSREATSLTTLPVGGGPDGKSPILVRPGEGVGYCVYAMHRRKDIYGDDADEFRPERWEDGSLKDIGWAYLPFNGGPRLCLGRELPSACRALTTLLLTVSARYRGFRVAGGRLHGGTDGAAFPLD